MTNKTSEVLIREAQECDVAGMVEIYNYYVANSTATFDLSPQSTEQRAVWLREHRENGLPVFVMEQKESGSGQHKIIGFAGLSYYHSRCAYKLTVEPSMYIASASCHSGFGKQLMKRLMTAAANSGYHAIVALVCGENVASIRLARSFGFEEVGLLKEVGRKFDRWLDVSILQKVL